MMLPLSATSLSMNAALVQECLMLSYVILDLGVVGGTLIGAVLDQLNMVLLCH